MRKIYCDDTETRAIMVDDEIGTVPSIIRAVGFTNVIICDPESFIELEELHETDKRFKWTEYPNVRWLRTLTGLTQTAFGDMYDIPMRTIQNWENDVSVCPLYVYELLERAVLEDFS